MYHSNIKGRCSGGGVLFLYSLSDFFSLNNIIAIAKGINYVTIQQILHMHDR